MKRLLFFLLSCISMASYAMQQSSAGNSTNAKTITLVNNCDQSVEIPYSIANKCKTLMHMRQDFSGETILPVGHLTFFQLNFVKEYLTDLEKNTPNALSQKLQSMNIHELHQCLEATNFLDIKPKKPLIKAITAKLLEKQSSENLLHNNCYSITMPQELLRKIRKEYAQTHTFSYLLSQIQISQHRGNLPEKNYTALAPARAALYNKTGTQIAQISRQGSAIELMDTTSEKTVPLTGHILSVSTIDWCHDSIHLASAGLDNTIKIWNANTARCKASWTTGTRIIDSLAWHPQQNALAIADKNFLTILDTETGTPIVEYYDCPDIHIADCAWNSEGQLLGTALREKVVMYDIRQRKNTYEFPSPYYINCLTWNPRKSSEFAAGTSYGKIFVKTLFNASDSSSCERIFDHKDAEYPAITRIAWHPTQNLIASGSFADTLKMWNPNSLQQECTLPADYLSSLHWNPNGCELALGRAGGLALLQWHDKKLKQEILNPLSLEEMRLQHAICNSPETVDPCASQLQETWNNMHPLVKEALLKKIPYTRRFSSWFTHTIIPSLPKIGCNHIDDEGN